MFWVAYDVNYYFFRLITVPHTFTTFNTLLMTITSIKIKFENCFLFHSGSILFKTAIFRIKAGFTIIDKDDFSRID